METASGMKRLALIGLVGLAGCATTPTASPPPATDAPPADTAATATVAAPTPLAAALAAPAPATQNVTGTAPPAEAPTPRAAPPTAPSPPAPALSRAQFVALNDERLLDVYPGMSRRAVEQLMHIEHDGRPWNPFKRESLQRPGGQRYDVVFYLTREPARGKPITEAQLTPVIFQGDTVYAIGRHPLKKLRKTLCGGRCS